MGRIVKLIKIGALAVPFTAFLYGCNKNHESADCKDEFPNCSQCQNGRCVACESGYELDAKTIECTEKKKENILPKIQDDFWQDCPTGVYDLQMQSVQMVSKNCADCQKGSDNKSTGSCKQCAVGFEPDGSTGKCKAKKEAAPKGGVCAGISVDALKNGWAVCAPEMDKNGKIVADSIITAFHLTQQTDMTMVQNCQDCLSANKCDWQLCGADISISCNGFDRFLSKTQMASFQNKDIPYICLTEKYDAECIVEFLCHSSFSVTKDTCRK